MVVLYFTAGFCLTNVPCVPLVSLFQQYFLAGSFPLSLILYETFCCTFFATSQLLVCFHCFHFTIAITFLLFCRSSVLLYFNFTVSRVLLRHYDAIVYTCLLFVYFHKLHLFLGCSVLSVDAFYQFWVALVFVLFCFTFYQRNCDSRSNFTVASLFSLFLLDCCCVFVIVRCVKRVGIFVMRHSDLVRIVYFNSFFET